jgi:hypothetical protein
LLLEGGPRAARRRSARAASGGRGRRRGARPGGRRLVELSDLLVDADHVALVLGARHEHAGFERRHLDGDLVGLELDDGLARLHGVTLLPEPARDGGFHDRLAEGRDLDRDHSGNPRAGLRGARRANRARGAAERRSGGPRDGG